MQLLKLMRRVYEEVVIVFVHGGGSSCRPKDDGF
jgi:hypothetical protein